MTEITISDEAVVAALRAGSPLQRAFGVKRMHDMREALEAAAPFIIAAERERCAKIADTYAKAVQPSKAAFEGIAQAIRSGELA